jgi:hypothetical protein
MFPFPPFFRRLFLVFGCLCMLFWCLIYGPSQAKKDTLQHYASYLAQRRALLVQSRLLSLELLQLGRDTDGEKRGRKITQLRDILNKQIIKILNKLSPKKHKILKIHNNLTKKKIYYTTKKKKNKHYSSILKTRCRQNRS